MKTNPFRKIGRLPAALASPSVRGRRLISGLGLSLLVTVAAILVIEAFIFYALDIKAPGYRPDRFMRFSPAVGWKHKPNASGYWYRYNDGSKFYVSINSCGFSDSERKTEKSRPRIALIGDSTTEFWEMDPGDRGQDIIEELLGGRFEMLNFGIRGYGTDQTYLLLKDVVASFSPDIVIYTFCINDVSNNGETESKPYFVLDPDRPEQLLLRGVPVRQRPPEVRDHPTIRALDVWARNRSFIYRKSRGLLQTIMGYHYPLGTHLELRPNKIEYDDEDRRRMEVTLGIIGMMNEFCKANGMRFLLVEGIYRPALDERYRQRLVKEYGDIFDFSRVSRDLRQYSADHGIEFLSLPDLASQRGLGASDLMHVEDTMHLDKRGVAFWAGAVVDRLRYLGWLGDEIPD
jgi:lysophospholipase L1-like esterase